MVASVTSSIMPSNSFSSRRKTLKRPIVCKSKETGICGACELSINLASNVCNSGATVEFPLTLFCDPDPRDTTFIVTMAGAFTPLAAPVTIVANGGASIFAIAPLALGDYLVRIDLLNSTRCAYFAQTLMHVV